jgi:hypothetical protein
MGYMAGYLRITCLNNTAKNSQPICIPCSLRGPIARILHTLPYITLLILWEEIKIINAFGDIDKIVPVAVVCIYKDWLFSFSFSFFFFSSLFSFSSFYFSFSFFRLTWGRRNFSCFDTFYVFSWSPLACWRKNIFLRLRLKFRRSRPSSLDFQIVPLWNSNED